MPTTTATTATLAAVLDAWSGAVAGEAATRRRAVADTIGAIATAAARLEDVLAAGSAELAATATPANATADEENADATIAGRDVPKAVDLVAHDLYLDALRAAPVRAVLSEEADEPLLLDPTASGPTALAVAIDPLDGSANVATNAPVGTIFSLLPDDASTADPAGLFRRPGHVQLAAGYVVYGPATVMALTVGQGTHLFVLDRRTATFELRRNDLAIPRGTREFAINAANQRHWDPDLRTYVEELLAGREGPRGEDFNMRWMAALVVEAHRILLRGGIFLYPGDDRPGYRAGRLRRVYEAFPIALLVEQAGGAATDGTRRLLDTSATALHERTPLVFGSADKVSHVTEYRHTRFHGEHSPLFRRRGLFRS